MDVPMSEVYDSEVLSRCLRNSVCFSSVLTV